jgi:hypothetical protein
VLDEELVVAEVPADVEHPPVFGLGEVVPPLHGQEAPHAGLAELPDVARGFVAVGPASPVPKPIFRTSP